jgi:hypothetical protein
MIRQDNSSLNQTVCFAARRLDQAIGNTATGTYIPKIKKGMRLNWVLKYKIGEHLYFIDNIIRRAKSILV